MNVSPARKRFWEKVMEGRKIVGTVATLAQSRAALAKELGHLPI